MDNAYHAISLVELQTLAAEMSRERWRLVSDVAQVVANYLRCHPAVRNVRYPGLKGDPQFQRAANSLSGGFGPIIDYRTQTGWTRLECDVCDARELIMRLEDELRAPVGQ